MSYFKSVGTIPEGLKTLMSPESQKERKKRWGVKHFFWKNNENFLNLVKDTNLPIQEAQQFQNPPGHIINKLQETKGKGDILKAVREQWFE